MGAVPKLPISQIKYLRKKKGFTQRELAERWRMSSNSVRSWETEVSKAQKLAQFIKLCTSLDCSHKEFIIKDANATPDDINFRALQVEDIRIIRPAMKQLVHISCPISTLRNRNSISQEKLAEMVGVDFKTIQNWEKDRTARSRHNKIAILCEILGCSYIDLVLYKDDAEERKEHQKTMDKGHFNDHCKESSV